MSTEIKELIFLKKTGPYILLTTCLAISLAGMLPLLEPEIQELEPDFEVLASQNLETPSFPVIQENTLLPISTPVLPENNFQIIDLVPGTITAYSSTPCQTDETPYLTAAGTWVREGIVANNKYSLGTKIRIPELYGDKIFVIEDRMHWTKGVYQFDIWMDSYGKAKNFGVKRTYIEILED